MLPIADIYDRLDQNARMSLYKSLSLAQMKGLVLMIEGKDRSFTGTELDERCAVIMKHNRRDNNINWYSHGVRKNQQEYQKRQHILSSILSLKLTNPILSRGELKT